MTTPPFLLGVIILFWGLQVEIPLIAGFVALVLEGTRFLKWKCDFSRKDFTHIADICSVLLVAMMIYIIASSRSPKTMLLIIKWLPLPLYPLVFFQWLSTSTGIELGSLLWFYRKSKNNRPDILKRKIDVSYPYMALCVLGASVAKNRSPVFYITFCILAAWTLLSFRSKRYSFTSWVSMILVVVFLGYCGHVSLHYLQKKLEETVTQWLSELVGLGTDPYENTTSIGDTLELKHSSKIIARVKPRAGDGAPRYLRTATYNIFSTSVWFDSTPYFRPLLYDARCQTWKIGLAKETPKKATIYFYLDDGSGVLPVPPGTYRITNLFVSRAEINRLGTIKVEEGPDLATYDAYYTRHLLGDSPPRESDLQLPSNEINALDKIAHELDLYSLPPRKAVAKIKSFFKTKFTYSLNPPVERNKLSPLSYFLLKSHCGHCEYFATATVLLLRKIRIPARYVTGYVVSEYSKFEKMFIVRQRHSHAWVLAYVDGRWQNLDTTPQSWFLIDKSLSPPWEPLYDIWANLAFMYDKWKWSKHKNLFSGSAILWIAIPLLLFLGVRLYTRKGLIRYVRVKTDKMKHKCQAFQGKDSDFYTIVEALNQLGYERQPWESMKEWVERVSKSPCFQSQNGDLCQILNLHYRYRFDPLGIGKREKEELRILVRTWHQRMRDK